MTDKTQPEALRLALSIDLMDTFTDYQQEELNKAAAELRRQHARIAELEVELEAVGAGGVQALSAAPQQEAQEPATAPRFNCWSTNEGDSWFDHPADSQAIYDCLGNDAKVGDEYELTAGWKSVTARYRITEVVGDGEEYEVECISHQQENTAPQQGAQEPALFVSAKQLADLVDPSHATGGSYLPSRKTRAGLFTQPLYTAPQPAPAPLSDEVLKEVIKDSNRYRWLRRPLLNAGQGSIQVVMDDRLNGKIDRVIFLDELDKAIDAAIAAQKDAP